MCTKLKSLYHAVVETLSSKPQSNHQLMVCGTDKKKDVTEVTRTHHLKTMHILP